MGKGRGYVNGYQFNENFVKPFTAGTGCSVALLENPSPAEQAEAHFMLSHSWAQCMDEVEDALLRIFGIPEKDARSGYSLDGRRVADGSARVWFCIAALYQPEDGAGPSVDDQVKMDPFGCVIRSLSTSSGEDGD